MTFYLPPVLPPKEEYDSQEDPERAHHWWDLEREYEGTPWLTLLVNFSEAWLVFFGSIAAMGMLVLLFDGNGTWWPWAVALAGLVGIYVGSLVLRRHRGVMRGL